METIVDTGIKLNTSSKNSSATGWKEYQKILFRIAFVFFVVFCVPTDAGWYKHLFRIDWTNLHARDLYDIASIRPHFVEVSGDARWGIGGYLDWLILLVFSIVAGGIWTLLDRKRKEYNQLYYWLRTLVRYRAALGIIGFSFEKIFPTQMPYPSLAHLTTDFGDFSGHKIYWTSFGISPWYQVFGGFVELVPGILLLFRRTTFLGAAILTGALSAIAVSNRAHDGGVHVYASYFVLLGIFIMLKYIPSIYNFLILERTAFPDQPEPVISEKWLNYIRAGVKVGFALYIVSFLYLQYLNFRYDPYKQPSTAGVKVLRGLYNVKEFRLNNKLIPFSPLDSVYWQDVTLESWTTLTFRKNKPLQVDLSNSGGGTSSSGTGHSSVDLEKNYEGAGVSGGRRVYHYFADEPDKTLYLLDKNLTASKLNKTDKYPVNWIPEGAQKNIGNDNHKINSRALSTRRDRDFAKMDKKLIRDKMILHYSTSDGSEIILKGTDENRDSLYIVLERVNKKFTLSKSSIEAGSY